MPTLTSPYSRKVRPCSLEILFDFRIILINIKICVSTLLGLTMASS